MDSGVLDISLALSCQLLVQISTVLVFDVLDDGIPASVIVDQVTVARGIDNVQTQTDAIFLDDVRDGLDIGGGADRLIRRDAAFTVEEVRSEDGVDQCRLSQSRLS